MKTAFSEMSYMEAVRFMAGKDNYPLRWAVSDMISGRSVADLGCGKGFFVKDLYDSAKYTGYDVSEHLLEIAREKNPGFTFIHHDITERFLPLMPKSVDVALMISVLEHQPNVESALMIYSEAVRVANETIIVWNTPPSRDSTELTLVKAELDGLLSVNFYKRDTFARVDLEVRQEVVCGFECWRVRSR